MPKGYRKKRLGLVLEAGVLCEYGCNSQANYRFKSGKICCSKSTSGCPEMKIRHSQAEKENYRRNSDRAKNHSETMKGRAPWNIGLTKYDHPGIARRSEKLKGGKPWNDGLTKETDTRVAEYGKKTSKERVKVDCDWCGKELKRLPKRINETNFCNSKCKSKWDSENMMNEKNPVWVPKIMVKCDWCEKPLERLPKKVKETNFCDRECQNEYHSKRMSGEGNPAYEDGKSLEPYSEEFNERLKERIRERDGHICQFCQRTEIENWRKHRRKLNVHHIDYDKRSNGERNLISLCQTCHSPAHFDREFWQAHYEARIREIYSSENVGKI